MILLSALLLGLSYLTGKILVEELAIHYRYAKRASESFARVENVYPRFKL